MLSAILGLQHEAHQCQADEHRLTEEEDHSWIYCVRQDCPNGYSSTGEEDAGRSDKDEMAVRSDPGVNMEHCIQTQSAEDEIR